jgi:PAS domain S-box-containing protein
MADPLLSIHLSGKQRAVLVPLRVAMAIGLALIIPSAAATITPVEVAVPIALSVAAFAAFILIRAGRVTFASYLLVFTLIGAGLVGTVAYGSIRSETNLTFVGAVVFAGVFLGRRALAAVIVATSAIIGAVIYAEHSGRITSLNRPISLFHWLVFSVSLGLIGILVHYARIVAEEAMERQRREIDERTAAEALIRQTEERLRLSMEVTRQGWFDLNVQTGRVTASASFAAIIGADPDKTGMSLPAWIESIHPEDRVSVLSLYTECLATGNTGQMDYRIQTMAGEWKWIRSIARVVEYDEHHTPLRMTGTHTDITEQVRATDALIESEERYRAIVDLSPVGIMVHRDGRVVFANPAATALLGASSPDALVGLAVMDIVDPANRETTRARIRDVQAGVGLNAVTEQRFIRCDGTTFEANVQGAPVIYEGTQAIQISFWDVSERKHAETAIRESEAQLRIITDTMPGFVAQLDRDMRYRRINWAYQRALGRPLSEMIGKHVRDVLGDDDWEQVRPYAERALAGEAVEFETQMHVEPLKARWIRRRVTPAVNEGGEVTSIVVLSEDVTAAKEAELAALRSAEEFRSMIAATTDGFIVVREGGAIIEANSAFCEMTGFSRNQLLGTPVAQFVVHDAPLHHATPDVVLDGRAGGQAELVYRRKDGSTIDVEVSSTYVPSTKHMFCFVRDISERRHLNESRLRSQKLESLGTLAGGIAHDFNNILAAIRGNVELAADDVEPSHPARESLDEIRKAGSRASELVRRITAFGRPKQPTREIVELPTVVQEVLKLLRPTVPAGIALHMRCDALVPHVLADSAQLHEAVVNLTTNAVHAIGNTVGAIDFEIDAVEPSPEEGSRLGLSPRLHARLTVKDTGCGMSESTIARIFDAFYTTKPVGEGTGLGLSMVYGIMQSHGGAVSAESTPGEGARFHLYFPAVAAEYQAAPTVTDVLEQPRAPRRVLYVDDEPSLLALAERALTRRGHSVTAFSLPEKAIVAFRAQPDAYDLVITDLAMPQMSGLDLARQIRAIRADIPIVMFTGHLQPGDEASAREIGIQEVVVKAGSVHDLARVVDRAFSDERHAAPRA